MLSSTISDSERKTVGVFASKVGRAWGAHFLAGIANAAEANNVNLVYFIGDRLTPQISTEQPKASFGLYDLAKSDQLDGLILTADVAYGAKPQELKTFMDVFGHIPIVTQSVALDDATMFVPNNADGMRSAVRHLIEEHGYKRIAFISGMQGQVDADQRFRAYQDELKAHDLRYDENLVVDGDFTSGSGRDAIYTLLDQRKLRFQAVVAANDRMAFGVLDALKQRGLRVPEDVAVTGFDDLREAQATGVPLTTVRQSFYTAGKNALEALLKRIQGDTIPHTVVTPTQLLVRWSCGCLPENVRQAAVLPRDVAKTGKLENKREMALRALLNAAGITEHESIYPQFKDAFGRAWDGFLLALSEKITPDEFLKSVNAMIELMQQNNLMIPVWHNVISMMRRYALGGITSHTVMLKAENLFQQARLLAGELSQRTQAYRRLVLEQQESILQGFSFSMAPAMTLDEIGSAISEHFPKMGIQRWYVMFYSDVSSPQSITSPTPDSYSLLLQYEGAKFEIPQQQTFIGTGQLVPRGKTPQNRRYTAIVMPLTLARNRFGFMWVEMGPQDWEIYVRIRNLVSSALLRTMLAQQKELAQKEVERLLTEARERAAELAIAKEFAENTASENASLYASEQTQRRAAEALTKTSRQLASLSTEAEVPQQIVEQLAQITPSDCLALFIEDVNGNPHVRGHVGFPENASVDDLQYRASGKIVYTAIVKSGEPLVLSDLSEVKDWQQPEWHPPAGTWVGVPLFSKKKVMGMLTMSRKRAKAFTKDDVMLANAFATQASIALENARLYDEVTRFNQMMERMVEQRVDELNKTLARLEKMDKNKSDFIQVAAHELRTPLTVIKGYMGMIKSSPEVKGNETLAQAMDGVLQGTDRLHQVVNSMLDVARLESEVLTPRTEAMALGPLLRMIQKDYTEDLKTRHLTLEIDPEINTAPPILAESGMLKKALDNVIVNAIKFTPDGGRIDISAERVNMDGRGEFCEIRVKDTGIGIDSANHAVIFEKLYQVGKVALHSSGRTKFMGGGPGLGLAIAAGIIKAHQGKIWVESPGYDEKKLPGSTFFIHLPIAK